MLYARRRNQGPVQLQGQESLILAGRGGGLVRSFADGKKAERGKLVRQQVLDVADAHRPAEVGSDPRGDLADRAAAVDPAQHQVQ